MTIAVWRNLFSKNLVFSLKGAMDRFLWHTATSFSKRYYNSQIVIERKSKFRPDLYVLDRSTAGKQQLDRFSVNDQGDLGPVEREGVDVVDVRGGNKIVHGMDVVIEVVD